MMYGAEAWTLTRKVEELLERAEMRLLRWILEVSLRDRRRNEDIREVLGVACITDKVREARMRWFGHVMRREDGCCIKRIINAEVYGRRSRGRQKKRWRDKIQEDLKTMKLKKTLMIETSGEGGSAWLTPPLGGINSSLKENEREITVNNV